MPRQHAPRLTDRQAGPQGAPQQDSTATQHKGWPFPQGSQNHLDETSAPWPRPARLFTAKPSGSAKPDQ